MVRPRFSPRPMATGTAFASGQSHTSAGAGALSASDTLTLSVPLFTARASGSAINDDLRRVNLSTAAPARLTALPRRMRRIGQRVTPAEIIPVIDGNAQRDDRRI